MTRINDNGGCFFGACVAMFYIFAMVLTVAANIAIFVAMVWGALWALQQFGII